MSTLIVTVIIIIDFAIVVTGTFLLRSSNKTDPLFYLKD